LASVQVCGFWVVLRYRNTQPKVATKALVDEPARGVTSDNQFAGQSLGTMRC
jgi:hypothetical protein